MKISYLSDLHLEFGNIPNFSKEEGGDVLILAGDIVVASYISPHRTDKRAETLKKAVTSLKVNLIDKYDIAFYVVGNHEHYNGVFSETHKTLRLGLDDLGLIEKVIILEDNHHVYKGVPFIGATLWSDFMKEDPISMLQSERCMNDFHIIQKRTEEEPFGILRASDVLSVHKTSLEYIKKMTKFYDSKDCVVITHHAPSYASLNPEHSGNVVDGAYASDLSETIFDNHNIKYWIHGHSHLSVNYKIGECRVLASQRGYEHETSFKKFTGPGSFRMKKIK